MAKRGSGYLRYLSAVIISAALVSVWIFRYEMPRFCDTLRARFLLSEKPLILDKAPEKQLAKIYRDKSDFLHTGHFLLYVPQRDLALEDALSELISMTTYLHEDEFVKDFCALNSLRDAAILKGRSYLVPGPFPPLAEPLKKRKRPTIPVVRGLYYTGDAIGQRKVVEDIIKFKGAGINTVVFDVKDIPGNLSYKSNLAVVREIGSDRYRPIDNISALLRYLRENDIYVIARIACFRDDLALKEKPQWAIQSARGGVWNRNGRELWLDPTNAQVQQYAIDLACEIADLGADEIQFDYVRFPTEGDRGDAVYAYNFGRISRRETIAEFLKNAQQAIHSHNANFSIDIFGVVAWGFEGDIESTGQQIGLLAGYCDVISPMLYPSHFNDNFRGKSHPGDEPYYFIYQGSKMVAELSGGRTHVRPWLQAFGWRVSNYNAAYIKEQVRASIDAQCSGYLFWNAKNSYDTVISALAALEESSR